MSDSNTQYVKNSALVAFGITTIVWLYGVSAHPQQLRMDEVGFALLLFIVPTSMVIGAVWVALDKAWWRVVLGAALLVPSIAVWGAILLFAYAGFRIH
ncbi:MAG: hypothetical protein ACR2PZ_19600 [Pseudomonadales bacterium]